MKLGAKIALATAMVLSLAFVLRAEPVSQLKPSDYVNDFAHVLDQNTVAQLDNICLQIDQQAHAQIAVVTINSLDGSEIVDYSVDLYQKWEELSFTNSARNDYAVQMTKLMGVAAEQSKPLTGAGLYAARSGSASTHGLMVNVNFVSFADSFEGAPAILDWLCAKGCIGIRYSVISTPFFADGDNDD